MTGVGLPEDGREILIEGTPYRIVDANGYRRLMVLDDPAGVHSTMALAAPDVLVTPYKLAMLRALPLAAAVRDILLIGLGGGQQAKFLRQRLPLARLVAVEVDPRIVQIAHTYFHLAPGDERFRIVVADGLDYVRAHPDSFDLILCDGYDTRFDVPASLAGMAFYRACFRALRSGGVMALNLDRRAATWGSAHLRRLGRIFDAHVEIPVKAYQSVLLLARDALDLSSDALLQRAAVLETALELDLPAFVAGLVETGIQGRPATRMQGEMPSG